MNGEHPVGISIGDGQNVFGRHSGGVLLKKLQQNVALVYTFFLCALNCTIKKLSNFDFPFQMVSWCFNNNFTSPSAGFYPPIEKSNKKLFSPKELCKANITLKDVNDGW